jgi:hypothetical protein
MNIGSLVLVEFDNCDIDFYLSTSLSSYETQISKFEIGQNAAQKI